MRLRFCPRSPARRSKAAVEGEGCRRSTSRHSGLFRHNEATTKKKRAVNAPHSKTHTKAHGRDHGQRREPNDLRNTTETPAWHKKTAGIHIYVYTHIHILQEPQNTPLAGKSQHVAHISGGCRLPFSFSRAARSLASCTSPCRCHIHPLFPALRRVHSARAPRLKRCARAVEQRRKAPLHEQQEEQTARGKGRAL